MSDWLKKYSLIINIVFTLIILFTGWSLRRVVNQLDQKADKEIVEEKLNTVGVKIQSNSDLIKNNQQNIQRTQELFLGEIKMLRQELQLKQNRQ